MMKTLKPDFSPFSQVCFYLVGLVFCTFWVGCRENNSSTSEEPNESSASVESSEIPNSVNGELDEELRSSIPQRVEKILEQSLATTTSRVVNNAHGDQAIIRVPIHHMLPITPIENRDYRWKFLNNFYQPTPGQIALEFQDNLPLPKEVLLANDQSVLLLFDGELVTLRKHQESWKQTPLLSGKFQSMQWNQTGEHLLIVSEDVVLEYNWKEWNRIQARVLPSEGGKIQYSPTNPNTLWNLSSKLQFDPSVDIRVRYNIRELGWDDQTTTQVLENAPLASIGTLPLAKIAWVLDIEQKSIMPNHGVLQRFDLETKTLGSVLTENTTEIDFSPSADLVGNLVFLRAEEFPRNQTFANTTAWSVPVKSPKQSFQLTTEPTQAVTTSPDGLLIASIVFRNGKWKVLISTRAELEEIKPTQSKELSELKLKLVELSETIRTRFEKTVNQPSIILDHEQLISDAIFLREQFNTILDLELTGELDDFSRLDELFNLTQGDWQETPELVFALGCYIGTILQENELSDWSDEEIDPELSYNLQQFTFQPKLSLDTLSYYYHGLKTTNAPFDFFSPFRVARERIAGRLQIQESVEQATNFSPYKTILTERFERKDVVLLLKKLKEESSTDYNESIQRYMSLLEYRAFGIEKQDQETAIKSALEAAETYPMIAENLVELASALAYTPFTTESRNLAKGSLELESNNPEILYKASRVYLDLDLFDEALALHEEVRKWDLSKDFEELIAQDAKLIHELKSQELEQTP